MNRSLLLTAACFALSSVLMGCGSTARPPLMVRAGHTADLVDVDVAKQPVIIEFQEGDVIPLDVLVAGDLVAAPEGTSVPLTAKRRFFVRVDASGLKVSLDGKSFEGKARVPGSFAFGFGVTKTGTRASLSIKTPVRD